MIPPAKTTPNKQQLYAIITIIAGAFIAYFNSFNIPFLLDDNHMLQENIFITHPKYFINFFTGYVTSFPVAKGMCRPFLMLSFALNYWVGGLNVISYHILNFSLHLANGLLLFWLIRTIKDDLPIPAVTATVLLFLIHPINTEAVSYISSRSDLTITFFMLIFIISIIKEKNTACIIAYLFALMFKESALFFPFILAGYLIIPNKYSLKEKIKKYTPLLVALLAITLLYLIYRKIFFAGTHTGGHRAIWPNIFLESWASFFYLRLFAWPDNINILHAFPDFAQPYTCLKLLPFIFLSSLAVMALNIKERYPAITLGLFIFLAALAPKFYATLKVPAAEHHFYPPSIGIYIILAILLTFIYQKNRYLFYYPIILITAILTILTWERNYQLQDHARIWQYGIQKEPGNMGNWINIATIYRDNGQLDKAEAALKTAQTIANHDPDWQAGIYANLAMIYFERKNYPYALDLLQKGLDLKPNEARTVQIYKKMAQIFAAQKLHDKSLLYWNKAYRLASNDISILQGIAEIKIDEKKWLEAKRPLDKALSLNPNDYYTYFLLSIVYETMTNDAAAQAMLEKSIQHNQEWFYSHYRLSLLLLKKSDIRAGDELEKSLQLKPDFLPALHLRKMILALLH